MAAATIVETRWGFYVTGGTDATTIKSGKVRVKAIGFAGNADNATCALTSLENETKTAISCAKFKTNADDLDMSRNYVYFGERGVEFESLACTLSNAGDYLYIYNSTK